jgi:hypothetical protein
MDVVRLVEEKVFSVTVKVLEIIAIFATLPPLCYNYNTGYRYRFIPGSLSNLRSLMMAEKKKKGIYDGFSNHKTAG